MLPDIDVNSGRLKHVYLYAKPRRQIALTYEQVLELTKRFQQVFIFSTHEGFVTHERLLKNKTGGLLFCSIK